MENTGSTRRAADDLSASFPPDYPRGSAREYRGASEFGESADGTVTATVADVVRAAAALGVDPLVFAGAALALVLHRHTTRTDVHLGLRLPGDAPSAALVRVSATATYADLVRQLVAAGGAGDWPVARVGVVGGPAEAYVAAAEIELLLDVDPPMLGLRYDANLFQRATARWLLAHCRSVLAAAAAAPATPVTDLRMTDGPATPRPVGAVPMPAGYSAPPPPGSAETLVTRLDRVVAEHGDRIAVRGPGGVVRYAELGWRSAELATEVATVAPRGSRVAVLCAHDIDLVPAVMAVLRAGAAYVPLDPRQPVGRLARLAAVAEVGAVLCDPSSVAVARVVGKGLPVLVTSGGSASGAQPAPPEPTDLAYLLHTSGSTGEPKAVVQSHRNVLGHAVSYADSVRLGPGDRITMLARASSDAGVMDLFGGLLSGATLTFIEPLQPAAALCDALADGIDVLHCTPTLFRHLTGTERRLDGVRVVVLGGEEATSGDLRRCRAVFPAATLVNGLGPTECTLALRHVAGPDDLGGTSLPVGRAMPGVTVDLLDAQGRPTEVFGELCLTGERVALGYWGSESAAFGKADDGTPNYRTGDYARYRADGSLVHCGRMDRQVKVRGHRVEPAGIESALRAHPTVAQAVAIQDGQGRLVAYVTAPTPFPPDGAELLDYLGRYLPDYAVPWTVVVLDELPVGPTGKVDRSRLPAPSEPVGTDADDGARTPTESAVATVWCEVLGIDGTGLSTNFMAAGGDSVRMVELLAAVSDRFGVEVALTDFLAAPTVRTLVDIIEGGTGA